MTKKIKVSTIKPNPNNPRVIRDEKFKKLVQSIKDFPQMMSLRPMVVDEANVLLGGNMRLRAIQELGMKEIPDAWVKRAADLTEKQKKEFSIKDNVAFGQWDWDMIANEWDSEELQDWGLDVWVPEEIDLDEFFSETKDDGSGKKGKIVLEYSEDEYDKVVAAFNKIGGSKEQIVWKLLNLDDEE